MTQEKTADNGNDLCNTSKGAVTQSGFDVAAEAADGVDVVKPSSP